MTAVFFRLNRFRSQIQMEESQWMCFTASRPAGFISIGHDPGANSILMNNLGQIFIHANETGKLFFVAQTFGEFLGSFA
jgi:hypothetical protein